MEWFYFGAFMLALTGWVLWQMRPDIPPETRKRNREYERLKGEFLKVYGHRWRQPTRLEWQAFEKRAAAILDSDDPGQKYWP